MQRELKTNGLARSRGLGTMSKEQYARHRKVEVLRQLEAKQHEQEMQALHDKLHERELFIRSLQKSLKNIKKKVRGGVKC